MPRRTTTWARRRWRRLAAAAVLAAALAAVAVAVLLPRAVFVQLTDGRLGSADYWTAQPKILSAGLGFEGIIGVPSLDEETVRAAEGSWDGSLRCSNGEAPEPTQRTSTRLIEGIDSGFVIGEGAEVNGDDGLPVVFSWPVATDTVDPTDFRLTLNTGRVVTPNAAGMLPNWERNERSTVVLFGDLANRLVTGEAGAEFPVRLDIVADDSPLLLRGPDGDRSAVGLSWTTKTGGYEVGPSLVGAKLNRVGTPAGEGGVRLLGGAEQPNDEVSLYGDAAQFRLRMLTTGGFSPDGRTAIRPDEFARYFRLVARGPDGGTVRLTRTGVTYRVAGGELRILGLSDLGKKASDDVRYDACYQEDGDNYIDVVLAGDEAAARSLTVLEIPGDTAGYDPLYNPGGPGARPFPGVRYTRPGPPDREPITMALDDPMRVTR